MTIQIFTTGGSIDKVYSTQVSQFIVGEPAIKKILEEGNITLDYEIESLLQKDSLELTDVDREIIANAVIACPYRQVIVTHGTDTMVETALSLSKIPGKVIVLTGSMQPAKFRQSDATFNIGSAVMAVQILDEGVYLVINGQVFDPTHAVKNVAYDRYEVQSEAK